VKTRKEDVVSHLGCNSRSLHLVEQVSDFFEVGEYGAVGVELLFSLALVVDRKRVDGLKRK
jgi:hypothetical protein